MRVHVCPTKVVKLLAPALAVYENVAAACDSTRDPDSQLRGAPIEVGLQSSGER